MSNNVILIDRAKHKNTPSIGKWYAEHEDGTRTGPYATKELTDQALDENWHLTKPHLKVPVPAYNPDDDIFTEDDMPF